MKRTAKWQQPLTLSQLRHLRDNGVRTLQGFFDLNAAQEKRHKEMVDSGVSPTISVPCWDCREIARRLRAAGIRPPCQQ